MALAVCIEYILLDKILRNPSVTLENGFNFCFSNKCSVNYYHCCTKPVMAEEFAGDRRVISYTILIIEPDSAQDTDDQLIDVRYLFERTCSSRDQIELGI